MHERAIDLPRLHSAIFEKKDAASGVQLPRGAECGFDECEASAEHDTFGGSAQQSFSAEIHFPPRGRTEEGCFKGGLLVSIGGVHSRIQTRRSHWTVKTDPAKFLPQKNLE